MSNSLVCQCGCRVERHIMGSLRGERCLDCRDCADFAARPWTPKLRVVNGRLYEIRWDKNAGAKRRGEIKE